MGRTFNLELRDVARHAENASIDGVSLELTPGALHALVGDAGCRTLLRIAGLLDLPDAGELFLAAQPLAGMSEHDRARLRSKLFGYIFATPCLLPSMTVVENVAVPYFKVTGTSVEAAQARAAEVLGFVGLAERAGAPVGQLTRGEQQRLALARGLVHTPAFLIVDHSSEPSPAHELAAFLDLLREVPGRFGAGVIAAMPPGFSALRNDRVVTVRDGTVRREPVGLPQSESSAS